MQLAIFDIDGTLTATSHVDAGCYVCAFKDAVNLEIENGGWDRFTNYTDSGIMHEIFLEAFQRGPSDKEDAAVQSRFMQLLKEAHFANPADFAQVSGAAEMLVKLRQEQNWAVAMATGCWRLSAEFKLDVNRFERDGIPISTCDEHLAREAIMQQAVEMASAAYGVPGFDRIVYIGDGVWDLRASRKLGFSFIGVQHETFHKKLENEGARVIIQNYENYPAFLRLLHEAPVPD